MLPTASVEMQAVNTALFMCYLSLSICHENKPNAGFDFAIAANWCNKVQMFSKAQRGVLGRGSNAVSDFGTYHVAYLAYANYCTLKLLIKFNINLAHLSSSMSKRWKTHSLFLNTWVITSHAIHRNLLQWIVI